MVWQEGECLIGYNFFEMRSSYLLKRLTKLCYVLFLKQPRKAILSNRVLAGTEHRKLLQRKLVTVVDVGANRGQFTLAARTWAEKARIISFEPLTDAANHFQKLFRNDSKVTLHKSAIASKTGKATLHIAAADDSSSLLPILPLQEKLFPGTGEIKTEIVEIGPLSNYLQPKQIKPPSLLKIDVQGYELEVLRGCENLLDCFTYVYVECSFMELYAGQPLVDDVIAWLRERHWRLNGIHNILYDRMGSSIQGDFLFEKAVR